MPKLATHLAVLAVAATGLAATATPAHADQHLHLTCQSGAGYASVNVWYDSGGTRITRMDYLVYNEHGVRDLNNIIVGDSGTAPATRTDTDSAVSDGDFHLLREDNYARGQGTIRLEAVFDVPDAGDPRCSDSGYL